MLKNIDFRAVLLGSIADWIGTNVFGGIFYGLISVRLAARGLSQERIQEHYQLWSRDVDGFLYILFFGLCFTFFGGYLAAKVSRTKTLVNSILVGAVSVLTSLFFIENTRQWDLFFSLSLLIPASTLGGYHYFKQLTFNDKGEESQEDQS